MGIYIKANREWLKSNGEEIDLANAIALPGPLVRWVFWQSAPWGENCALAYDKTELRRLDDSGVFPVVYSVPVEKLREIGVHEAVLKEWR